MSTPFIPIPRPPLTQNCEEGINAGAVPSQICNPDVICNQVCRDVDLTTPTFPAIYHFGTFSYQLPFTGTAPIVWAVTAGALPTGVTLNTATGLLSASSVTQAAGSGSATITATNCTEGTDAVTWAWTVLACTAPGPVLPASGDIDQPVMGEDYSQQFTATGTTPIIFTIDPLPTGATFTEAGLLTIPADSVTTGEQDFTVTATGPCGSTSDDYTIQGAAPVLMRYGNITSGASDPAPTFIATDFTGGGPQFSNYTEFAAISPGSRVGNYNFTGGSGVRQIMWIADSLLDGSQFFTVAGLPWVLDPAQDTALQSLTILGVPGKIFYTANRNNGVYVLHVG